MTNDTRTITRPTPAPTVEAIATNAPAPSSEIRSEVSAFGDVARESRRRLQRGADAEREMQRRRNDSGQ